jgi:hypothetical protein
MQEVSFALKQSNLAYGARTAMPQKFSAVKNCIKNKPYRCKKKAVAVQTATALLKLLAIRLK